MADVKTFEVDAKLHQSMWDPAVLLADRSSKAEQLLIRPLFFLRKTESVDMEGS
jgi:hypothetical protein